MSEEANQEKKPESTLPQKKESFLDSKTFRFITLGIYLSGLSGLGMTLAFYYLFLWDSRMPPIPEIKPHQHVG